MGCFILLLAGVISGIFFFVNNQIPFFVIVSIVTFIVWLMCLLYLACGGGDGRIFDGIPYDGKLKTLYRIVTVICSLYVMSSVLVILYKLISWIYDSFSHIF